MTPSTIAPAVSAPLPGVEALSLPPVETMTLPELAGYLSAMLTTARLALECGLPRNALATLTEASEALARRDARPFGGIEACPWCGAPVRAGEPSTRCGGRPLHDACMAEMVAAEGGAR